MAFGCPPLFEKGVRRVRLASAAWRNPCRFLFSEAVKIFLFFHSSTIILKGPSQKVLWSLFNDSISKFSRFTSKAHSGTDSYDRYAHCLRKRIEPGTVGGCVARRRAVFGFGRSRIRKDADDHLSRCISDRTWSTTRADFVVDIYE